MSRASWYRHGKPKAKPAKQTLKQFAAENDLKLRTLQRYKRAFVAAQVVPAIADQLKQVECGELRISAVDRWIGACLRLAREERESVIQLPDLTDEWTR